MNSTSKDIGNVLDGVTALGLTLVTDLFYHRMPDDPDNCVAVFDNPGEPPMLALKKITNNYYYSSISIRARNIKYETGWQQLYDIMVYLHGLGNFVEDGTLYTMVRALGNPQLLHFDENDRANLIINFDVQRRNN